MDKNYLLIFFSSITMTQIMKNGIKQIKNQISVIIFIDTISLFHDRMHILESQNASL